MRQAEKYLNQSNKIKKKLTRDNLKYYEDLRSYTIFAALTHDEAELEEQLLTIVTDLEAAQADGLSAESYFGKNPQESADALIQNLAPSRLKEKSSLIFLGVGIIWLFEFISDVNQPGMMSLNWLTYLLQAVFAVLFVVILFKVFQKMVYPKKSWLGNSKFQFLLIWLLCVAWIGLSVLLKIFIPAFYPIPIIFPLDMVLILGIMLGALLMGFKSKEQLFYPMLLLLEVLGGLGLLQRLAVADVIAKIPTFFNLGILIIAYLIYFAWSQWTAKKMKTES